MATGSVDVLEGERDDSRRSALELVDVDEVEGQAVSGLNREPAVRQCHQGPAPVSRHGMTAVEFCLIEVLKGVPEVGAISDLGKEIKKVLAAGSRNGRRCHRRADVPRGRRR
jgi:hypothetical protein